MRVMGNDSAEHVTAIGDYLNVPINGHKSEVVSTLYLLEQLLTFQ